MLGESFDEVPVVGLNAEITPTKNFNDMKVMFTPSVTPINPGFEKEVGRENVMKILKNIKLKYVNKLVIGNLNICTLAKEGKLEDLTYIVKENLDILVLTETKLDETYSDASIHISGFSRPFRVDRNKYGGGVLVYIREDIPSKELTRYTFPCTDKDGPVEGIFIELNLKKCKWLLLGSYHPPSQSDDYFFNAIGNGIDANQYDNFLLVGDFNAQEFEPRLNDFLVEYDAKNLVKENTCFKSMENPSCIDLFITNRPRCFMKTTTLSTGLSDFHKMSVTVMRADFPRSKPRDIHYRDYKHFDEEAFRSELKYVLSFKRNKEYGLYEHFKKLFIQTLDKHASKKIKKPGVMMCHI